MCGKPHVGARERNLPPDVGTRGTTPLPDVSTRRHTSMSGTSEQLGMRPRCSDPTFAPPLCQGCHRLGYIRLWVPETPWVAQAHEVVRHVRVLDHSVFIASFSTALCPGFMSNAAMSSTVIACKASTVSHPSLLKAVMYGFKAGL